MSPLRTHLFVASTINLVIVGVLVYISQVAGNNAILIFVFFYILLLFANIMMWATAGKVGKAYMINAIALGVLFVPLWLAASPG